MDYKAWNYKGTVAVRLGEYEEADDAYSESLRLQPTSHATYTKRSEVRLLLQDPRHALADAHQALALKPTYVKAYVAQSDAYAAMNDLDRARHALEQGLQVARGDRLLESALDKVQKRMNRETQQQLQQQQQPKREQGESLGKVPSGSNHGSLRRSSAHRKVGSSGSGGSGRPKTALQAGSAHSSTPEPARRLRMSEAGKSSSSKSLNSAASATTASGTTASSSSPLSSPAAPGTTPPPMPSQARSLNLTALSTTRRSSWSTSTSLSVRAVAGPSAAGAGKDTGRKKGGSPHPPATRSPRRSPATTIHRPPPVVAPAKGASEFVQRTRAELQEQMKLVQAQLAFVELLAHMSKGQKLDLLFGLIDLDRSGTVDAQELAVLLRSRNHLLTTGESISRAVAMVKAFDEDGNAELDRDEFELFFQSMVQHLRLDFDELAEYLSLELSFPNEDPKTIMEKDDDDDATDVNDGFFNEDDEEGSVSASLDSSSLSFHPPPSADPATLSLLPPGSSRSPRVTPSRPSRTTATGTRRPPSESSLPSDGGGAAATSHRSSGASKGAVSASTSTGKRSTRGGGTAVDSSTEVTAASPASRSSSSSSSSSHRSPAVTRQ